MSSVVVADSLEARRYEIVEIYQERLRARRSPLVVDEGVRGEVVDNAHRILTDCVRSLRAGRLDLDEANMSAAVSIGISRASAHIPKSESLWAAETLFDVLIEVVGEVAPASAESFALVARALQHSIMSRVALATAAHDSYLLNMIQDLQIEARRQLARELHDRFGSELTLTLRRIELYEGRRGDQEPDLGLSAVKQVVVELVETTSRFVSGLVSPPIPAGLAASLRQYVHDLGAAGRVGQIRVDGQESWLPPPVREQLFLVVREAVSNAVRHSGSDQITVSIDIAPFSAHAAIEDQGVGFDHDTIEERSHGHGLASMQERVAAVGGVFLVTTKPDRGTRTEVWVPYQRDTPTRGAP